MNKHSVAFLFFVVIAITFLSKIWGGNLDPHQFGISVGSSIVGVLGSVIYWIVGNGEGLFKFPDMTNYTKNISKTKSEMLEKINESMKDMSEEEIDKALDLINAISNI